MFQLVCVQFYIFPSHWPKQFNHTLPSNNFQIFPGIFCWPWRFPGKPHPPWINKHRDDSMVESPQIKERLQCVNSFTIDNTFECGISIYYGHASCNTEETFLLEILNHPLQKPWWLVVVIDAWTSDKIKRLQRVNIIYKVTHL